MRYNSYEVDDVLRYVTSTVQQAGHRNEYAAHPAANTPSPQPAITVTVTHTEAAPAATITMEVEKEKEVEVPGEAQSYFDAISAMNTTITLPKQPVVFDPKGPPSNQIILLTAADGEGHNHDIENLLELAAGNRRAYCEHHGYIYSFINIGKYDLGDIAPVWKKLPAIVEAFNDHPDAQWLFWLDLDAIIMTPEQDLQSLILSRDGMRKHFHLGAELHNGGEGNFWPHEPDFENIDFIIAQDHNGINAGSFLLRRTQFTQMLLDMWADPFFMHASFMQKEQDALIHLLKHHKTIREHTGIAKQRAINAFVEGPSWMMWEDGDLLVHLAGCWVQDLCASRWAEWWNKRGHLRKRSPVKP